MHVPNPASPTPESTADWRPDAYRRFEAERTRPAADLLARVPPDARRRIADLGCGPGNSTALLAERHPQAAIVGLDSSPDMLAAARTRLPRVDFRQGDIAEWSDPSADLVFANAALHWVPDHIGVMRRLAAELPARERIGAFADYDDALSASCDEIDIWRTTYVHRLAGPDAVVAWVESAGLRPFLNPLDGDERADFLARYRAGIARAYPPRAGGGALLPFPRLFIVATRREWD
jgi:trans-aconitate 2-methyltransferase